MTSQERADLMLAEHRARRAGKFQLNPMVVRQQIENLKVAYPSLFEDREAWLLTLESETDLNSALTAIVKGERDDVALELGAKIDIEDSRVRKARYARRIEARRHLAFKFLEAAGIARVELPIATLSLRAGTQELVGDANPEDLPDEFCRIKRELNKTAIKEAVESGVTVPGFSLSNGSPSITIRKR